MQKEINFLWAEVDESRPRGGLPAHRSIAEPGSAQVLDSNITHSLFKNTHMPHLIF